MEELLRLAEKRENWTDLLDELQADLDCEDAVKLAKNFFELAVVNDVHPVELRHILVTTEDKYFDCPVNLDWDTAMFIVTQHGSKRAFVTFFKEKPFVDKQTFYDLVLSAAQTIGMERLSLVTNWLARLTNLRNVTQYYIGSIDNVGNLTPVEETILQYLLKRTQTNLHDYRFHVNGSVSRFGKGSE